MGYQNGCLTSYRWRHVGLPQTAKQIETQLRPSDPVVFCVFRDSGCYDPVMMSEAFCKPRPGDEGGRAWLSANHRWSPTRVTSGSGGTSLRSLMQHWRITWVGVRLRMISKHPEIFAILWRDVSCHFECFRFFYCLLISKFLNVFPWQMIWW